MEQEPNKQNTITARQESVDIQKKKPFYKRIWFIVIASIVGLVFIVWPLVVLVINSLSGSSASVSAADTFYEMLETAGQKKKVHFLYETKRAASGEEKPLYVRSLAELDGATKEYSVAFISDTTWVRAGRCVKGKEYATALKDPDTLMEAEDVIKGKWTVSTDRFSASTCDYKRSRYHGSVTDAILPHGATEAQVKGMIEGLKSRDAIAYKDEGIVTYDGKKARKISFELSKQKSGKSNADAGVFFFTFRDGASSKVGANFADLDGISEHFEDRLYQTSPTPELKGYYLIDEQERLPLFSEIATIGQGVAPTTYTNVYSFPDVLTMNEGTPLPQIPRP